jgi:Tfp pilus assembly protein PilF
VTVFPTNVRCLSALARSIRRKDSSESEQLYRAAYAIRPAQGKLSTNFGELLFELGRYEEAEPLLRHALAVNKEQNVDVFDMDVDAHVNLGALMIQTRRIAEAEAPLIEAMKRAPNNPRVTGVVGALFYMQGRYAEAVPVYERSLRVENSPDTWFNLAISYDMETGGAETDENDKTASVEALKRAIDATKQTLNMAPKHANALKSLAEYQARLQQLQ